MIDPDEYYEYHESKEELAETHADHSPILCPIGKREDCQYLRLAGGHQYDEDDTEFWCEHPEADENENECPLNKEDDDAD